ncbi:MAG: hypothetical protein HZB26_16520 [Candidatus Hydrogenedentes bacterium]|nr:hypothetical protein [Candidatus Hydrogenedentota bacterium]
MDRAKSDDHVCWHDEIEVVRSGTAQESHSSIEKLERLYAIFTEVAGLLGSALLGSAVYTVLAWCSGLPGTGTDGLAIHGACVGALIWVNPFSCYKLLRSRTRVLVAAIAFQIFVYLCFCIAGTV